MPKRLPGDPPELPLRFRIFFFATFAFFSSPEGVPKILGTPKMRPKSPKTLEAADLGRFQNANFLILAIFQKMTLFEEKNMLFPKRADT